MMENSTGQVLLRIIFGVFAVCMAVAAIAFNLEMLKLSLIFFAATIILAVVLIGMHRMILSSEKKNAQKK